MQLLNICWLLAVVLLETSQWTSSAVPKEVEDNLMSLFGFHKRPKIDRSQLFIPQAMLDLYQKQTGHHYDTVNIPKPGILTKSANTIRSFTHIESPIDARFPGHHRFRLKFNVEDIPKNEKLKAAELTINREIVNWLLDNKSEDEYFQHVLINDIVKPGVKGKREPITRLIDSKLIDTRKNTTLSLDVLPAVERWLESSKNNHGLIINVVGYGKMKNKPVKHLRLKRNVNEEERMWVKKQPLLFTYTDDGRNKQLIGEALAAKRARRAAAYKRRKNKKDTCKRHGMYVDFEDVGWSNWIVAPPGYQAYYCHGECNFPLAEHLNTTNHAIVQTLVNSMSPNKVPKACCVPTTLSSISMLYLDDTNKVVLKNYKDMTVIGCGCR